MGVLTPQAQERTQMFTQGIVGLSLGLLTATPVLAQMGSLPARASNTGGARMPAAGQPPKVLGTGTTSACTPSGGLRSAAPLATLPPSDLLHKSAAA
jgi:hypothetical protein